MYHVGDFILRIKNAYQARNKQVVMPFSRINKAIANILIKEGFLAKVEESDLNGRKIITAILRYKNRKPAMRDVRLYSKPSMRIYVDVLAMNNDKDRESTSILSTSNGIMTGKDAKKKGIGGELLFKVW